MRIETVIAKSKWEQVRGTAQDGVGTSAIHGRHENASVDRYVFVNLLKFPALNQGNVRGDHECAFLPTLDAHPSSHFDRAGFTGILEIRDDFEVVLRREFHRVRIAGDNSDPRPIL